MKNATIEKIRNWRYLPILIGMLVVAVPRVISAFPIVWFGDSKILVFAIDRMVRVSIFQRMDAFEARVLGNHVRETEYGEIRLGHGSLIEVSYTTLLGVIRDDNFRNGRASHNLVVEGIVMPESIWIAFRGSKIALLALDGQEIIVSGVLFSVGNIELAPSLFYEGMVIGLQSTPEYVLLADSVQINFIQGGGAV